MKLYLAQHGDYLTNDIQSGNPLSNKGKEAIDELANFLKPLAIEVSAIFHSGILRAKQTAEILSKCFICYQDVQQKQGLHPTDDVLKLISEIDFCDEDLLLVGHLPFLSRLASRLILQKEDKDIILFKPGTLACLEKNTSTPWIINWVLHPTLLKES